MVARREGVGDGDPWNGAAQGISFGVLEQIGAESHFSGAWGKTRHF